MNTNKLPENWVIDTEKEKDSPLMPKFIEWIEKNRINWVCPNYRYFGIFNNFIGSYFGLSEFQSLVTLNQWHEAYFPEWQPKQGELIMVRDSENAIWQENIFAVKYNGKYFTEKDNDNEVLLGWDFAKPFPKETKLQPKINELKAEAERLGLKIEIVIS